MSHISLGYCAIGVGAAMAVLINYDKLGSITKLAPFRHWLSNGKPAVLAFFVFILFADYMYLLVYTGYSGALFTSASRLVILRFEFNNKWVKEWGGLAPFPVSTHLELVGRHQQRIVSFALIMQIGVAVLAGILIAGLSGSWKFLVLISVLFGLPLAVVGYWLWCTYTTVRNMSRP